MYTVKDIINIIDGFAPFRTQYSWDNCGLQCGDLNEEVKGITIALDLTTDVLEEAAARGSNLIVTHHPVIFTPLKRLEADSLVYQAVKKGVSVVSAHTNLDVSECGVNKALADALGLSRLRPLESAYKENYNKITVFVPEDSMEKVYLAMCEAGAGKLGSYERCAFAVRGEGRFLPVEGAVPTLGQIGKTEIAAEIRLEMIAPASKTSGVIKAMLAAHPYEVPAYDIMENKAVSHEWSLGFVGVLPHPMKPQEMAEYAKERLGTDYIRLMDAGRDIKYLAICSGSGGSMVNQAAALGADALLTGDVKHDAMLLGKERSISIIDAGHFATENIAMPLLKQKLEEKAAGINIEVAGANIDPVKYI